MIERCSMAFRQRLYAFLGNNRPLKIRANYKSVIHKINKKTNQKYS